MRWSWLRVAVRLLCVAPMSSAALLVNGLRQRLRQLPQKQPAMPLRTWVALVDWAAASNRRCVGLSLDAALTPMTSPCW